MVTAALAAVLGIVVATGLMRFDIPDLFVDKPSSQTPAFLQGPYRQFVEAPGLQTPAFLRGPYRQFVEVPQP
jgi:hypothetical protein